MKKQKINFMLILLFCGVVTAQNQNGNQEFLNAQFLILDEVQPLTQAERNRIESIFYREFADTENQGIAFNLAMSRTLENLDYFTHYYKDEIEKRAYALYNENLTYYREKMGLSDSSLETIKPTLKEQSDSIALYEVIAFGYPDILFSIKEAIVLDYEEDISEVYIRNDAVGLSYNLGLVLENRNRLRLNTQQVNDIVDAAQIIKQLTADGEITEKKDNCWLWERKYILDALNEEQIGEFAVIRYTDDAVKYAIRLWKEGKSYKMEVKDSIQVLNELFHYQINKLKIQYVYHDKDEKMREMENFWYKEASPSFLRQLDAERRRRQYEVESDRDNLKF